MKILFLKRFPVNFISTLLTSIQTQKYMIFAYLLTLQYSFFFLESFAALIYFTVVRAYFRKKGYDQIDWKGHYGFNVRAPFFPLL